MGRKPTRSDARFLARFTLLLPDTETARAWARIKRGCEKKGRPISFADAWIAAAAVQLNIPLVTHNASDYTAVENLIVLTVAAAPQCFPRSERAVRPAECCYCTETVTPLWLLLPPTKTDIGMFPDGAFAGIWTLSCITPETKPGASP